METAFGTVDAATVLARARSALLAPAEPDPVAVLARLACDLVGRRDGPARR